MTRDGRGEIVGASVLMLKGENSRDVVARVKAGDRRAHAAPARRASPSTRTTTAPTSSTACSRTVAKNLSEGALLVVVQLLLTLGSLRAGLLVAGAIPFAMLVGILGLSADRVHRATSCRSAPIDFGIVVEGAVVIVEHLPGAAGIAASTASGAGARILHAMAGGGAPGRLRRRHRAARLPAARDARGRRGQDVPPGRLLALLHAGRRALLRARRRPGDRPSASSDAPASRREPWLSRQAARALRPARSGARSRGPRRPWPCASPRRRCSSASASRLGAEFLPRIFEGVVRHRRAAPAERLADAGDRARQGDGASLSTRCPRSRRSSTASAAPRAPSIPSGPESSDVFVILKPREQWRHGADARVADGRALGDEVNRQRARDDQRLQPADRDAGQRAHRRREERRRRSRCSPTTSTR